MKGIEPIALFAAMGKFNLVGIGRRDRIAIGLYADRQILVYPGINQFLSGCGPGGPFALPPSDYRKLTRKNILQNRKIPLYDH